jgi:hypothetical protein
LNGATNLAGSQRCSSPGTIQHTDLWPRGLFELVVRAERPAKDELSIILEIS